MPRKKKSDIKIEEVKSSTINIENIAVNKESKETIAEHDTKSAISLSNKKPKAVKPKKQKTMDDVIKQNAIKPKVRVNKFKVGDNVRCKVKMETLLRVYSIRMKDHDYPIVYRCLDNMNNFSLICEDMLVLD